MKAIIWTKYGPPEVLQLQEVDIPSPGQGEVLIKVHAATASTPDSEFRQLKLPRFYSLPFRLYLGILKPTRRTILGTEFAGEIVAAGKDVTQFQTGDQLFGYTGLGLGTYAEYLCLSEAPSAFGGVIGKKPENLSYAETAAVPFGGLEALHAIRKADLQPGQKVLIVGAGGSIGTYAIQLAKLYGAEVTGVDKPGKLEMLGSIGADHVIDYTREDFTNNGRTYDVVLDTIDKSPFSGTVRSLNDQGTYLNANPGLFGGVQMRQANRGNNKKILRWTAGYSTRNLQAVKELVEAGKLKPVIDRIYPLEQIVEAHRYVDTGQKKGNVVITVG